MSRRGRLHTLPSGQVVHVGGRRRPVITRATHPHMFLALHRYCTGPVPNVADYDYTTANQAALADILGNDSLGYCTSAGAAHIIDAMTGLAAAPGSLPTVITRDQAVAFYSKSTGYDPSNPASDQGGDEVTVCQTWKDQGYLADGSHKNVGWVALEDFDPRFIKWVGSLFPLYFGVELSDAWLSGSSTVWDVGQPADPNNGHCVVGLGGNAQGIIINTWGQKRLMTYAAIAQFCADSAGGNLFAILTQDALDAATCLTVGGVAWDQLQADLVNLGAAPPDGEYPTPPTGP